MHCSHKLIYYTTVLLFLNGIIAFGQESTAIMGKVLDQNGYEVPYAAVGILQKNIGTTSTEDGTFYFRVSNNELEDNLTVSSLGFSNFSIKIKDFLKLEKKEIILEEQTTNLSEVVVNSVDFYVKNALKKLRDNTVSKNHQLNILYRKLRPPHNMPLCTLELIFSFYEFLAKNNNNISWAKQSEFIYVESYFLFSALNSYVNVVKKCRESAESIHFFFVILSIN